MNTVRKTWRAWFGCGAEEWPWKSTGRLRTGAATGLCGLMLGAGLQGMAVDFETQVRPLFEARCYGCHGPDRQRGDLRLDVRWAAIRGGSLGPAWVPGDSGASLLIQLVSGIPETLRMPEKGDPLTDDEVAMLRAWVDAGAPWPEGVEPEEDPIASHWAFQAVRRGRVAPDGSGDAVQPLDRFIDARLAAAGLDRGPEADRATLVRRLHLVLLGVPPTPDEVVAFVEDPAPDVFERWVDRLLEDPRYGERWARHWLDVIRFAETNGFETNRERLAAWRFRDYVIDAFNRDKPFDRFIREQIAGDALGVDVATGFLVGGPVDIVGSPDPVLTAQQRADELDDMVNTTGTAFLGLTLGCARCHSHKFDPVTHTEYHGLVGMFAGVRHGDRTLPPEPGQAAALAALAGRIGDIERQLERFLESPSTGRPAGVLRPAVRAAWNEERFEPVTARALRFNILATNGGEPCLDELEAWGAGRNVALASEGTVPSASGTLPGHAIHQLEHINDGQTGNSRSWISNENGRGWVRLDFARPETIDRIVWARDREERFGDRLAVRYRIEVLVDDGRSDGAWRQVAGHEDREPFKGGATPGPDYRFAEFPEAEAREGRRLLEALEAMRRERAALEAAPSIYAGTFQQPGPVHRFHRGDPMQKREEVVPRTLAVFAPFELAADTPEQERRLRLAAWIADEGNPLTARVLVNRIWQHHFGVGLVDTPNDFGRNGSRPTHPELLDWLADTFMADGWRIKALQRRIVLSATWRQSGAPREAALRVDADARLLWRFPPRRLEAEAIRDSLLSVSGALDPRMGGPSFHLHDVDRENVYHYHPKEEFGTADHRRMVYAFKVRMEPDSIFGAFDCPDGTLVVPRRTTSTTPLQALNLFNSPFLMDLAGRMASRVDAEAGPGWEARIRRVWALAYGREPAPDEAGAALALAQGHGLVAVCRAILNSNEFLFIP